MSLMTSQYNVQRSELEASKAEIISEIEGAKNRIDVGISKGESGPGSGDDQVARCAAAGRHGTAQQQRRQERPRYQRVKGYLSKMVDQSPHRRDGERPAEFPGARLMGFDAAVIQGRRQGLDRCGDCGNSRPVGDAHRVEVGRSGSREDPTGPAGKGAGRRDSGQGVHGEPGLDQPDRSTAVPRVRVERKEFSGTRHFEEYGSRVCGQA